MSGMFFRRRGSLIADIGSGKIDPGEAKAYALHVLHDNIPEFVGWSRLASMAGVMAGLIGTVMMGPNLNANTSVSLGLIIGGLIMAIAGENIDHEHMAVVFPASKHPKADFFGQMTKWRTVLQQAERIEDKSQRDQQEAQRLQTASAKRQGVVSTGPTLKV